MATSKPILPAHNSAPHYSLKNSWMQLYHLECLWRLAFRRTVLRDPSAAGSVTMCFPHSRCDASQTRSITGLGRDAAAGRRSISALGSADLLCSYLVPTLLTVLLSLASLRRARSVSEHPKSMSNISQPPEFNFWEFVSCGICHLEYIKETGALSNVPFWLTECGHVACNAHISTFFSL